MDICAPVLRPNSAPNAAVVFTLAIGKEGRATDAHGDDALFVADRMAEAESIAARKATLLNPTEDDETALVLRRRLFAAIDERRAAPAIDAYRQVLVDRRDDLSREAVEAGTVEALRAGYPFHPELLEVLTAKAATLANFQRVRGMLRILGRTVAQLWQARPGDATALHVHHVDPGCAPIYQEIVTRLGTHMFVPAIRQDISAEPGRSSLAQDIHRNHFGGLAPYTQYVARTAFLHSLADKESLKGIPPSARAMRCWPPRSTSASSTALACGSSRNPRISTTVPPRRCASWRRPTSRS